MNSSGAVIYFCHVIRAKDFPSALKRAPMRDGKQPKSSVQKPDHLAAFCALLLNQRCI
jgi:hypothetical protein